MLKKMACTLLIGSSLAAMERLIEQELIPSALLIFLDDIVEEHRIGLVTGAFLAAFTQDAGPIVVSSSIIAHINELHKSPDVPHERALEIVKQIAAENRIYDKIFITKLDLKPDRWIVKEINPSLHLLLPKKYLQERGIESDAVQQITTGSVTATELALGLKVNHMKTVNFAHIRKPKNRSANKYFIGSLHTLFVTHRDYKKSEKQVVWSLFITGHGLLGKFIVRLSLGAFKKFLQFADTAIKTRFLVYKSCYAAGVNANLLYRDVESGVDITYSFAIVTAALTDAPTGGKPFAHLKEKDGEIVLKYSYSGGWDPEKKNIKLYLYDSFMKEVSKPDIDYAKAVNFIIPVPSKKELGHFHTTVPQIKYPGLSWFSVLDHHQVLTIGSILAKTWDRSFDFAKRSEKYAQKPLAILLYAQDIPFELVDNIFAPTSLKPLTFISMIPGNAVHHIKKITSSNISIEKILNSFYIHGLIPSKLFVIDAIQAPFFTGEHTYLGAKMKELAHDPTLFQEKQSLLTQVIISLKSNRYHIFFYYEGKLYEIRKGDSTPSPATNVDEHQKLWQEYGQWDGTAEKLQKAPLSPESIEKQPLQQQLTKASIALIKAAQEKKIQKIKGEPTPQGTRQPTRPAPVPQPPTPQTVEVQEKKIQKIKDKPTPQETRQPTRPVPAPQPPTPQTVAQPAKPKKMLGKSRAKKTPRKTSPRKLKKRPAKGKAKKTKKSARPRRLRKRSVRGKAKKTKKSARPRRLKQKRRRR